MNNKKEIVDNWLPRYTGTSLPDFGKYILLTNFNHYVRRFSEWNKVPINGLEKPMQNATFEGLSIINFGIGTNDLSNSNQLFLFEGGSGDLWSSGTNNGI